MNSNKMEETIPKIIDDEGQVSGPDDTMWGMDGAVASPELSHVLSQSILADGVPGITAHEEMPTERLRERIRYLETFVQGQNEALLRYESKERTHAAALRLLETTKTENSVLEYDRDRLFTENEFNKQQAKELSEILERFRERQNEMNECLLQTGQECNDKIAKLENELEHWKRKHESNVPRSDNVSQTESEQVEQLIHTEQAVGIDHEEQYVGLGHREQANGLSTNQAVGFSNTEQTGQLGHTEPSEAVLKLKQVDGVIGYGVLLHIAQASSRIECCLQCKKTSKCVAVNYNSDSETCEKLETVSTTSDSNE